MHEPMHHHRHPLTVQPTNLYVTSLHVWHSSNNEIIIIWYSHLMNLISIIPQQTVGPTSSPTITASPTYHPTASLSPSDSPTMPQPTRSPTPAPTQSPTHGPLTAIQSGFFCATDWNDAITNCKMRCPSGEDPECPMGEFVSLYV